MPDEVFENLSFDEAIAFFKGKLKIPTLRWDDLWKGMHARGFMVAGATEESLLTDFHNAILKAQTDGMTLAQFRKNFDDIVARHGWVYKGGRNWRSRVIFDTNIRTAYSAGRYKQMTDPDVLKARPYWEYRHSGSANPRPEHLAWDGLVLPADDPWWDDHYPPNGWGCKCKVFAVSERDLDREGKTVGNAPDDGTYEWTDKAGKTHTIPNGIDPGWDYNVGKAAWEKPA